MEQGKSTFGRRGSGHWVAPTSSETVRPLSNLTVIVGKNAQVLEGSEHHFLELGLGEGCKELQAGQPHLSPWEGIGEANSANFLVTL